MSSDRLNSRKAVIWNTLGSGVNAVATMVLTVVTSWVGGIEASGVMGLAFGLCFLFHSLACFEVRAYQSTDLEERFSFSVYLGSRLVTGLLAEIICCAYLVIMGYRDAKGMVILWVCTFKILEAVSDVFQGDFQQKGHLEYAGQSLFLKNVLGITLYICCYAATGNQMLAAMGLPLASALGILFFDRRIIRRFEARRRPVFIWGQMIQLLRECWPITASEIMTMYVLNAAKIQIDRFAPEFQGYWTALFMPAAFANLFGIFAFRPMLTTLRAQWNGGERRSFLRTSRRLTIVIAAAGAGIVCGGALLGIPILEILYQISLSGERPILVLILIGGGLHALSTFLWYLVIVMRRQLCVVAVDGVIFAFSLIAVPIMVQAGGMTGAAISYLCSTLLRMLLLGMVVMKEVRRGTQEGTMQEAKGEEA